jgi:iron(III) transport system substrate-binding protein
MKRLVGSRSPAIASLRRLTRRTLIRGSLAVAGAAFLDARMGAAATAPMTPEEEKLYAEARKEGRVVWWTAHYALSAAEAARDAFVARFPGIEVQFIRQTAQVIYQRLTQNLKAGVREVDVFASTDEAHYLTLKKQGVLAPYRPAGVEALPKAFLNVDPDNMYHVGALGLVLINYNTRLTTHPQKWTDLLDGRWQGRITLGHPAFSGYVGNWVVAMWDKYGWDYFTSLATNNPKIGRSINDTVAATTAASVSSVTWPTTVPVDVDWPNAGGVKRLRTPQQRTRQQKATIHKATRLVSITITS